MREQWRGKPVYEGIDRVVVVRSRQCQAPGCAQVAEVDCRTVFGRWSYLCGEHYSVLGTGLGHDYGQRLILADPRNDHRGLR